LDASRLPPVAGSVGTMSQCCSANATKVSVCSRKPLRAMGLQSATMNDIASWLRAQIPSSIDPARLERLAREAERQAVLRSGIATMVRERTPSKPPPGNNPPSVEGQRCQDDEAQPQLLFIDPATCESVVDLKALVGAGRSQPRHLNGAAMSIAGDGGASAHFLTGRSAGRAIAPTTTSARGATRRPPYRDLNPFEA